MQRVLALCVAVIILTGAGVGQTSIGARSGKTAPAGKGFLAGQLLVATPKLKGPVFGKTVILMLQHDANGALGLILNRPLEKRPLGEVMRNFGVDGEAANPAQEITIRFGGPVSRQRATVIHPGEFTHPGSIRITGFASALSPKVFLRAMAEGKGPKSYVFAVGYAGWAPGQLEGELTKGSWFVSSPDRKLIFDKAWSTMWRRAVGRRFREL